ncbi:MAG: LysR family transcriptional regulator [Oscillospiraceae bacterium]|nr:LysR family transcriptional regulator [Oscillospiraceae bacterium]
MELSAKYAYQVYKEKSFSAAAKVLYVSQPALSAAISRLEKELGMRIFDRTKLPLTLTPQGRIYIESIEEIMECESNMRRRIRELSDMSYGSLTIGGSSFASYFLMSKICGAFHKKYPQIKVTLDIGNVGSSDVLWSKLKNDEIDLLVTYVADHSKYITEPIYKERLVIAMHKEMRGAGELSHLALTHEEILTGKYSKEREIEDLSVFNNIEFIKYTDMLDTARRMTQMLGDFKTASCAIKNARHSEMHYNLMCSGIGAVITTDSAIRQKQHDAENILFFLPKSKESHRTIYIARQHSTDDNPIVKNFIQIAKAYSSLQ